MKTVRFFLFLVFCIPAWSDTIGQYMTVAENINRMEMKADSEAQAWVRSARNVLLLTSESIWESLNIANENSGRHLFCLPHHESINAEIMTDLIKSTYNKLEMSDQEKNQLTVAQIGLMGLQRKYPCAATPPPPQVQLKHRDSSTVQKMVHMGSQLGAFM